MPAESRSSVDAPAAATAPARAASTVYLACAALSLLPGIPDPARIPALAIALGWAPGALTVSRLAPGADAATRALMILVLSPLLAGVPAGLLLAKGASAAVAARVVLIGIALRAAWITWRPVREPRGGADPGARAALGAAVLWGAVVAAFMLGNPALLTRSDGWFHAALTQQIAARGLPPEDPWFAALPLPYFWGTHAWAALWLGAAPGASVWAPLLALDLAGAAAAMLGAGAIARRLGAGPGGVWAAAALAALGCGPFGWVSIVGRAFTGDVKGLEDVRRLVDLGGAAAISVMGWGTLHGSLAFFGDKFLLLTPFALGLAAFAAAIVALLDLAARPTVRGAVLLGLVLGTALFVHTLAGWAALAAAGGWWLAAAARALRGDAAARRAVVPAAVAIAAAVAALAPYLAATTLGRMGQAGERLPALVLGSWLLAGALLVIPSAAWLARAARDGGAARELLPVVVATTVVALALALPTTNQAKLFNLLFLLLAAPAAMGWLALGARLGPRGRAALALALAVAALPTQAIAFWAFAAEPGALSEHWQRPPADERPALRWIRDHAAPDAILVDAHESQDLVVLAARSVLCGGARNRTGWGHPGDALERSCEAARALGALREPPPASRDWLAGLGRDVLVVVRRRLDAGLWEQTPAPGFEPVYRDEHVTVLRWTAAP